MAEDKTGPLELLLVIFRALGAGKFETLYGLFGGGGGAGAHGACSTPVASTLAVCLWHAQNRCEEWLCEEPMLH